MHARFWLSFSILLCVSCSSAENINPSKKVQVEMRAQKSYGEYHYIMPKNEQMNFLANISKIKIGDSFSQTVSILGDPSYHGHVQAKKSNKSIGIFSKYYFRIYEENLVNEKYDQLVDLWFDVDGHLEKIATNVDSILELNLPNVERIISPYDSR